MIPTQTTTKWATSGHLPLREAHTHVVPSPKTRSGLPPEHELRERFGHLIWEAIQAFVTDTTYLAEAIETANAIDERREARTRETPEHLPLVDRLDGLIDRQAGHWLWTGSVTFKGNPTVYIDGNGSSPKPIVYEWANHKPAPEPGARRCMAYQRCVHPDHVYAFLAKQKAATNGRAPDSPEEFNAFITASFDRQASGHWIWTGHQDKNGPCVYRNGRRFAPRKLVAELIRGTAPAQLRMCADEPLCVNPEHTELKRDRPPTRAPRPATHRTPPVSLTPLGEALTPAGYLRTKIRHDDDHWLWTGAMSSDARPTFLLNGKRHMASRVAWEATKYPLTRSQRLRPSCAETRCINPDHMRSF